MSCDDESVAERAIPRDWRCPGPDASLCEREWGRDRAGDEPPRVTGYNKLAARPLGFGVAVCRVSDVRRLPDGIDKVENLWSGLVFDGLLSAISLAGMSSTALPEAPLIATFPTPTFFSHHSPMTPTPAAPGGHLYTLKAVPSSSHSVLRHFLSFAWTPGAENSILRGMIAVRCMELL